jgi:hypothetical protein
MLKRLSLASVLAITAFVTTPAFAGINVEIGVAPPPPQVEVVPDPRPGYVWAPGYWSWRHEHHVWVAGHWIHERRGHVWIADRWEPRGEHYVFVPGHWQ